MGSAGSQRAPGEQLMQGRNEISPGWKVKLFGNCGRLEGRRLVVLSNVTACAGAVGRSSL